MFERDTKIDSNEIIVDEKRRIAVNARNLTYFQNHLYARNYFKSFRPDLNTMDQYVWHQKLKMGEQFLTEMWRVHNREVAKVNLLWNRADVPNKLQYFKEEFNNFADPFVQGSRLLIDRNWEDASKVVAYMDRVIRRIHKYGLSYPVFVPYNDKEELLREEQELTERFVKEMRKPPRN